MKDFGTRTILCQISARFIFTRFFLQTNKLIVRTATRHLENKTEIGKGRLCRKKTQFSAATYFLVVVHTTSLVLQQHYQTPWSQILAKKKAKWVFCNELRNVLYVQFCKERSILRFFLIWYSIKSFGPIFEDWVECALCHPLQFRGSYCWIIWFLTMPTSLIPNLIIIKRLPKYFKRMFGHYSIVIESCDFNENPQKYFWIQL